MLDSNPLRDYFNAHTTGRGIWKWSHYLDIYHRHLQKFIGTEVYVLEVGVYSGGSLEMWRAYFGERSAVYGVDIRDECREYSNEHTTIFIGDQGDRGLWKSIKSAAPRIDVLIDDGSHIPKDQALTLEEMLPHLSPGGVYVCEDIHNRRTMFDEKRGTDGINAFPAHLLGYINDLNDLRVSERGVTATVFQRSVESIHFYPYMVVVEKAALPVDTFDAPKRGALWQPWCG